MDEDKKNDAFICYSQRIEMSRAELESKVPIYDLCIHERDWTSSLYPGQFVTIKLLNKIFIVRKF
ncbi:hypothetical protein LAZ67_5000954 [Cordylochernes scorpioides]|uniref:Uncharacterized protein n=1 Tax=Cordylochernes scorpioides TaxID=51811 RepID=A0ABY6KFC0_9ARAC|nr:hypothetical protein LAZ67_5000954 [Cordylochernes scorpioides]